MPTRFASRSALLLLVLALHIAADSLAADRVLADFDGSDFDGWAVSGDGFGVGPVEGAVDGQQPVTGRHGLRFANSYHGRDGSVGELLSPDFVVDRDYVAMLLGGGNHHRSAGAELIVDGRAVRSTTGSDSEELLWHNWDVRDLHGERARVRLFDRVTGGWGHVVADRVVLTDSPKSSYDSQRLERYRASDGYYRERYRPQVHFTPELNWMNDPNGLVYAGGEYHLFYQHNPFGIDWGHMSWGHAVSRDLLHWDHRPIALWEEQGVMIFSGCAVVDHENTSGFGDGQAPPIVAIYTSHQRGKQAQCLAYSNDSGRTFIKFDGNPVVDLSIQEFRDPKVFWHEPSQKWLMIVSKAADKVVQFYGSPDLKQWELLSEFGPAGAPGKLNWECPDFFELPVEDAAGRPTGESRWVLEADMGGGAVAGGSGGEYFVGTFDGRRFECDDPDGASQWVDFGRDFYASTSWSDLPPEDGRRIWLGWMNNFESGQYPTTPWRSVLSIPRVVSLRETDAGLRLVQRPIEELARLRDKPIARPDPTAVAASQSMEIELEAEVEPNGQVRLVVLASDDQQTVVGYDAAAGRLFLDRTRSGADGFSGAFAGVQRAPLKLRNGRLRLQVVVDCTSVEVFADDGLVVLTDLVYPDPESRQLRLETEGARVERFEGWTLNSIWRRD